MHPPRGRPAFLICVTLTQKNDLPMPQKQGSQHVISEGIHWMFLGIAKMGRLPVPTAEIRGCILLGGDETPRKGATRSAGGASDRV